MTAEETLSAKEVARELGTDARTLRKFFRSGASPVEPVGQGGRYAVTQKQIKKVKKAFDEWGAKKTKPAEKSLVDAMRERGAIVDVEDVSEDWDPEQVEDEIEDLSSLEPSDDDILELDDADWE